MRVTRLLALVLALAPTAVGCGDDIKFPEPDLPDPALNGVFPAKGFTDRTIRVEISGDGTEFTGTPMVAFGPGTTVAGVELSSPSTLFVTLTIAGDAAVGKRDVIVVNGDASLTLTAAFEIANPLEIFPLSTTPQGGISQFLIVNHDSDNPFFGDLEITGGDGTTLFVADQSELQLVAISLNDTDAVTGSLVIEDTLGTSTITSRGGEVTVTPRTATPMTPIGKGTNNIFTAETTLTDIAALFSFTADDAISRGLTDGGDPNGDFPALVWLVNGKWAQARGFTDDDLLPTTAGQTVFVAVFDPLFQTDLDVFVLAGNFHPLPSFSNLAEVENNDEVPPGTGTAQPITANTLFKGSFANFDDFDTIAVTVTAGQSIRITATTGPLGIADPFLTVYDDTFFAFDGADDDIKLALDLETSPLPAGTYFLELSSASTGAANDPYEAGISIIDNNQE